MLPVVMGFFLVGSLIEAAAYWLFNYKVWDIGQSIHGSNIFPFLFEVHPWKDMLNTAEQCTTDKQKETDLAETETRETHSILEDIIAWSQISAQEKVYEENKILGQFKVHDVEESSPVIGKIPREDLPSEEKDVHAESTLKGEIPARKFFTSAVNTDIATKIDISLCYSKVETEYLNR